MIPVPQSSQVQEIKIKLDYIEQVHPSIYVSTFSEATISLLRAEAVEKPPDGF